ncbi:hypothetical protein QQS21_008961 [Conoideocrella luteorostrata]|uniref:Cytochrome P450 n=1 Tax=Conoideocrella luteorostrata TaxID=1105319 RepID=A0AAJ0CHT7_9HYPO|nr:hypothetical protein QQS21_008961 [Conoideocrella luteorostrata]
MAALAALLSVLSLAASWAVYSWYSLFQHYCVARKVNVPLRLLPISHGNPFWMIVDRKVLRVVKRLLPWTRNSNFIRYNWRGWEVDERCKAHLEMGDVFMHVTPGGNSLHICNPDSLIEIFKRRSDFPRPLQIFELLNVFGPNLSTVEGHQWKKQRKMTATCFNERNNQLVWLETISQAADMIRYWSSKTEVRSTAEDTRTLSLHVLSRAGFGKSFSFQSQQEQQATAASSSTDLAMNYRASLQLVLDNCVLIMALGTRFLAKPWLPKKLRRVHEACVSFQQYMTDLYEQEKRLNISKSVNERGRDSNLMTALVQASADTQQDSLLSSDGLSEKEIYGNMFVFNFAGHDTTAHTLTFIFSFLAANPVVQDWLNEEILQVFGERCSREAEWDYNADFPRLKRCLAVLMETVRLYTPVPVAKWTGSSAQTLKVNDKTIVIPPGTMVLPSYSAIHTHPRFWGPDPLVWRPSRWIIDSSEGEELMVPDRGTFISWSEGERSCPGKKFSQVEVVAALATVLREWKVEPVKRHNESITDARSRLLHQIENDSAQVLLLQMLHPERAPLVWRKR